MKAHLHRISPLTLVCLLVVLAGLCPAQVITDGTVGPALALGGPQFQIPHTLGMMSGPNLFHSFQTFNLSQSQSATFTGPNSVANVFARVTGGNASTIDGTLRCSIPNANFYFINPAGVLFGPNASVDVGGSFAVTTADYVKLAGGGRFDVRSPANDVLTVAPPSAFGFLTPPSGKAIAGVQFNSSQITLKDGKTLTIASGPITAKKDDALGGAAVATKIRIPSGTLQAAAVASAGEMPVEGVSTEAFADLTDIQLAGGSVLSTSGDQSGGRFLVRGASLKMTEGASLKGQSWVTATGAKSEVTLRGDLQMDGGSSIDRYAYDQSVGGDLEIEAGLLHLSGATIVTAAFDQSQAGNLRIKAKEMVMEAKSEINSSTTGPGRGGNASITVEGDIKLDNASIRADTSGTGMGGNLQVTSDRLKMNSQTLLSTSTYAEGAAGGMVISAREITLDHESTIGAVSSSLFGSGHAGNISITADHLSLANQSGIVANPDYYSLGQGGDIAIAAKTVDLRSQSTISSSASTFGSAGSIRVSASESLSLQDHSLLAANTYGPGAGNIEVTTGDLQVTGLSSISAVTSGNGSAGNIQIRAERVDLSDLGRIVADSTGRGQGGSVNVTASRVTIDGQGKSEVVGGETILTGIFARSKSTGQGGDAGSINVVADDLQILNQGTLTSSTSGLGKGGSIQVQADRITIDGAGNQASIFAHSNSTGEGGDAGSIALTAHEVHLRNQGYLGSYTLGHGRGGSISVQADAITMDNNSAISTHADSSGAAGDILLRASSGSVSLTGGSVVASSAQDGTAGNISILAGTRIGVDGESSVSVKSDHGNAGTVTLRAPESIVLRQSGILAQAGQDGGNIDIDPHILGLESSTLRADAVNGNGGHIDIVADFVYSLGFPLEEAMIYDSQNQSAQPGTLSILSGINFANSLSALPSGLLTERYELRDGCARKNPQANSLIVRGKGGAAARPDAFLPAYDLRLFPILKP